MIGAKNSSDVTCSPESLKNRDLVHSDLEDVVIRLKLLLHPSLANASGLLKFSNPCKKVVSPSSDW